MRAAAWRVFSPLSKGIYRMSPWNRGFVNPARANRRHPIDRRRVLRLGGFVRRSSLATSGSFAEEILAQFNADNALISSYGFSISQGLSYADTDDASVSRETALIGDIGGLVTGAVPTGLHEELAEAAISVIETPAMRAGQAA